MPGKTFTKDEIVTNIANARICDLGERFKVFTTDTGDEGYHRIEIYSNHMHLVTVIAIDGFLFSYYRVSFYNPDGEPTHFVMKPSKTDADKLGDEIVTRVERAENMHRDWAIEAQE